MLPDQERLRHFWEARYATFALSESGWLGAGEELNRFLYTAKVAAVRGALTRIGRRRGAAFSILDAGCGQGYFARFYRAEYPNAAYVGVDISARVVEHLHATLPGAEFYTGDLSEWTDPHRRTFDIVQCLDVIHLLLDDRRAADLLTRLSSLVAPAGALLLTAPLQDDDVEPHSYLRYRGRAFWQREFERLGFRIDSAPAIYYWLPTGGPSNRYLRFALTQLGPGAVYWTDRLACAMRLPWSRSAGIDCRVRLLTLRRR